MLPDYSPTLNYVRKGVANWLARLARRIYPESPEVMSFYTDRMVEMAITGNSFIKVTSLDPADVKIIHSKLGDLYETGDGSHR